MVMPRLCLFRPLFSTVLDLHVAVVPCRYLVRSRIGRFVVACAVKVLSFSVDANVPSDLSRVSTFPRSALLKCALSKNLWKVDFKFHSMSRFVFPLGRLQFVPVSGVSAS